MKKICLFMLAALMCGLMSSCFSDDDNGQKILTPEEAATYLKAAAGSYTGDLIYPTSPSTTSKESVSWSVRSDSTMVISNFPLNVLATYISDNDLKAVVQKAPMQDIYLKLYPVYMNETSYGFYMLPRDGKCSCSFIVDSEQYTVDVNFSSSISGYQAVAQYANGKFSGYLLFYSMTLTHSGIRLSDILINTPMLISGTKPTL